MTQSYLAMRAVNFANGAVVTLPLVTCESVEDARAATQKDQQHMQLLLEAQLVTLSGPGEVSPIGMSLREFLRSLGITGVSTGCHTVPKDSPILEAKAPLIRLS